MRNKTRRSTIRFIPPVRVMSACSIRKALSCGATIAPSTFGMFQGAPLFGNFGDGTIDAFDFNSGQSLGQLQDVQGNVITKISLWELLFEASKKSGNPNTLDIPAGLNNEQHGLFAAITAINTQQPTTAVFSRSANPKTLTMSAGQPATFMLSVPAVEGSNCAVTFSCSGEPASSSYRHTQRRERRHRVWAWSAWYSWNPCGDAGCSDDSGGAVFPKCAVAACSPAFLSALKDAAEAATELACPARSAAALRWSSPRHPGQFLTQPAFL